MHEAENQKLSLQLIRFYSNKADHRRWLTRNRTTQANNSNSWATYSTNHCTTNSKFDKINNITN